MNWEREVGSIWGFMREEKPKQADPKDQQINDLKRQNSQLWEDRKELIDDRQKSKTLAKAILNAQSVNEMKQLAEILLEVNG